MTVRALTLDVRVGESVAVDHGRITLTVEEKSGQRARLRFLADDAIQIRKQSKAAKAGASQARGGITPK